MAWMDGISIMIILMMDIPTLSIDKDQASIIPDVSLLAWVPEDPQADELKHLFLRISVLVLSHRSHTGTNIWPLLTTVDMI